MVNNLEKTLLIISQFHNLKYDLLNPEVAGT